MCVCTVQDQTRQITALSKQMKQTESALKEELEKHDVTRQRAEAAQNRAKELENHLRDEKNTTADLRSELQSRNQDLRKKDEDFKKCDACRAFALSDCDSPTPSSTRVYLC